MNSGEFSFFMKANGFTLLELILTIAIITVMAGISIGSYSGHFRELELESARNQLISDLREARARAMAVEDGQKWGIHLVNGTDDYYELFSTPTDYSNPSLVIANTIYLINKITFTNPIESATKDIIFDRHTGETTADTVSIQNAWSSTKTITINASGNIQ